MKRFLLIFVVLLVFAMLGGCGAVYTNIKTPMQDLNSPLNDTPGVKIGKASCMSYVWVIVLGDCSVKAAMQEGEVTKIHHVDTEIKSILSGLYGRATTVVYGD